MLGSSTFTPQTKTIITTNNFQNDTINMAPVHTCPTPTSTSTNNSHLHCIKWMWVKLKGGSIKPPPPKPPGYGPENHNSPVARLIVH